MKNRKNFKILCALLALVVITTCVIGTTLARYTTSDSASDTARVAKWGIELSVGGTLFGSDYAANSATENKDGIIAAGTSQSVSASDAANIVAPGTKNTTGFVFDIKGTPEVQYEVLATTSDNEDIYLAVGSYGMMVEVKGLNAASKVAGYYTLDAGVYSETTDTAWDSAKTYYELRDEVTLTEAYYPLTWDVSAINIAGANLADQKNIADLATTLAGEVSKLKGNANNPSDASFTLTWEWVIDGNDEADTVLGNLIAGKTNIVVKVGNVYHAITVLNNVATANGATVANLDVTFKFNVTAQQVD